MAHCSHVICACCQTGFNIRITLRYIHPNEQPVKICPDDISVHARSVKHRAAGLHNP